MTLDTATQRSAGYRNTPEVTFRQPVTGNIPRRNIEALVMTFTIHRGKRDDAPARVLLRSAGLLGLVARYRERVNE